MEQQTNFQYICGFCAGACKDSNHRQSKKWGYAPILGLAATTLLLVLTLTPKFAVIDTHDRSLYNLACAASAGEEYHSTFMDCSVKVQTVQFLIPLSAILQLIGLMEIFTIARYHRDRVSTTSVEEKTNTGRFLYQSPTALLSLAFLLTFTVTLTYAFNLSDMNYWCNEPGGSYSTAIKKHHDDFMNDGLAGRLLVATMMLQFFTIWCWALWAFHNNIIDPFIEKVPILSKLSGKTRVEIYRGV
jgi:hypothetical protein